MASTYEIRVGTAGWSYKDWEGVFYPPEMRRQKIHPLEYLARCFDVVEINTSFYEHIRPELAKLWAKRVEAVNPHFVFTAKLHRSFTHSPLAVMEPTSAATIRPDEEDEWLVREGLDALAETGKFGALLIQFPGSFKNTPLNREYIDMLSRQFIEFPRVVEVRNSSWDNPETIAAFEQKNVSFCNAEPPLLGNALKPGENMISQVGYVRLHGRSQDAWFEAEKSEDRYNYLYKEQELAGWKEKIDRISERAGVTYVVAENYFQAKSVVNALELKHMLTGRRVQATETLLRSYPELKKIADPLSAETDRTGDVPVPA